MCASKRLTCHVSALIILLGIILHRGLCQNAEPRESFGTKSVARRTGQDEEQQDTHPNDVERTSIDWDDASPAGEKREDREDQSVRTISEADAGNGNAPLLLPEAPARGRGLNATTSTSVGRRRVNGSGRKKRRRGKDSRATASKSQQREGGEAVRLNEIRSKRGQLTSRGNSSSKKPKNLQERKYRAERRRRRKNRDRKRGRKRSRQSNERNESRKSGKLKGRLSDAPAPLLLRKTQGHAENVDLPSTTRNRTDFGYPEASNRTVPSSPQEQLTTEADRRPAQTTLRYGNYGDTVEREFSKQLEREISRTRLEDPSSLENRILGTSLKQSSYGNGNYREADREEKKFGSSRYDAGKMLGYSRTEEDLPILDMENEVLARTLKDYNAYMTSSLKLSTVPRHEGTDRSARFSSSRFHGKPIIDIPNYEREYRPRKGGDRPSTATYDEDNANGDLSCINGTFLPAPLARHALIKYVKSSIPGHEYLEADYECAPGFTMSSAGSRLLCRERRWIGEVPRCEKRQSEGGACAEAFCEHVCKEIDGRTAVCSCYKGFRLEGNKCIDVNECKNSKGGCEYKCVNTPGSFRCECPKGMKQAEDRFTCTDINECLLNNGHGPCQDTCRNTIGGYECSCESLLDSVLSSDNHTCQSAGPCSVNNAGCSHTCLSTMGRVFCLCPDGFILEDDWKTCQDVDECAQPDLQADTCSYGCINTPGSYRCAEPMELKDQPVLDSLSITCLPGYEATPDGTCIDIDECTADNGDCVEVCENTDGSFFCACDGDEKALSSDGKSCVDINSVACPPLNPEGRGYLMCSRLATPKPWRGRRRLTNRPGTKCFLKCPHGYQLHGEYELSCRSDGTWDGPKHGECVRYGKPRLECPSEVLAELPPGRDEAFVTFDQPSTDLDWFRYVRSKPSWGTRLEANLKPGTHEVTFFARHPVSKKQASCVLRIVVKGGEAPKVKDCPKDIEVTGRNGTAITWTEPIFTDNVKVTRIRSNESPGRRFDVGGHRIEYEASDEAGWSSKCVFAVVLRRE